MKSDLTPEKLDRVFGWLEVAAVSGARCPRTTGPDADNSIKSCQISALAHAGRIRVAVYAHNWRVITILEGPNKGKHTQLSPHKGAGKPYKIIDKHSAPPPSQRQKPWSPASLA